MVEKLKKIVVKCKKGMDVYNFDSDPLGEKYVSIYYRPHKFSLFSRNSSKKVMIPKGYSVVSIHNHKPTIGSVTIILKKQIHRKK